MVGTEGFIVNGPFNIEGDPFSWELSFHMPGDERARFAGSDQLEPIIPEGMESLEETLELWEPSEDVVYISKMSQANKDIFLTQLHFLASLRKSLNE